MVGIAKWQIIGTGGAGTFGLHILVSQTHQATHLGHAACSQVNAASRVFRQKPQGNQLKGMLPLEHLGVDFTEMKPH